jgi:hypothetical protein
VANFDEGKINDISVMFIKIEGTGIGKLYLLTP